VYGLIPERGHGKAGKDGTKDSPYRVCYNNDQDCPGSDSKPPLGKDSQILQNQADLGKAKSEVVVPERRPESYEHVLNFLLREFLLVSAQAKLDFCNEEISVRSAKWT